jgi:hypothetical protein
MWKQNVRTPGITYLAWDRIAHRKNNSEWPFGFVWTVGPQAVHASGDAETSSKSEEHTCNQFKSEQQWTEDFVLVEHLS